MPINTGNASEALLALKDGKWVVLRVPYPTGFYTKWMDGRIDDPNGGWKGKGLWATVSTRAPFHMEGGKGTTSKVLQASDAAGPAGEVMAARQAPAAAAVLVFVSCASALSTARPAANGAPGAATSASPATRRSIRSTPATSASSKWPGASGPRTSARVPTSTCKPRR